MKTILTITTFAFVVMVFAFNANPAMAGETNCPEGQVPGLFKPCVPKKPDPTGSIYGEMDRLEDPDNEKDVADSGNEGNTSAAQESDQ